MQKKVTKLEWEGGRESEKKDGRNFVDSHNNHNQFNVRSIFYIFLCHYCNR